MQNPRMWEKMVQGVGNQQEESNSQTLVPKGQFVLNGKREVMKSLCIQSSHDPICIFKTLFSNRETGLTEEF